MKTLAPWKRTAAWILGIGAAGLLVLILLLELWIGLDVDAISRTAMARYGGDRVEALIAQVDCDTCSLAERNRAVWALGQLADKRALPILKKYYTGQPCDHSRLICQREVTKAIRWCEGNSFMFPQIWRVLLSKG